MLLHYHNCVFFFKYEISILLLRHFNTLNLVIDSWVIKAGCVTEEQTRKKNNFGGNLRTKSKKVDERMIGSKSIYKYRSDEPFLLTYTRFKFA